MSPKTTRGAARTLKAGPESPASASITPVKRKRNSSNSQTLTSLQQVQPLTTTRTFVSTQDLEQAVQHVLKADPALAAIHAEHGLPTKLLATECSCFEALAKSVVFQQLHGKAAATIYGRLTELCKEPLTPASIMAVTREQLRGCGLSERKAEYITSLATRFQAGLEDSVIRSLPDEQLIDLLTQVKGVGPWTVHMLCMFSLGRADILPVGDLGVKKGMQELYRLPSLPDTSKMEELASRWAPYRSVGVYYMWRVPTSRQVKTGKSPGKGKGGTPAKSKAGTPTKKTTTVLPL